MERHPRPVCTAPKRVRKRQSQERVPFLVERLPAEAGEYQYAASPPVDDP